MDISLAAVIAVAATLLFTGAALVISVAEQPARRTLAPEAMLAEWRESYTRAAPMQAGLVVIAAVAAVFVWWRGGDRDWLIGGAIMAANMPWTLIAIRGVNSALKALQAPIEAPALVARWGLLHAVRTALGAAASLILLIQLG